MINYSLKTKHKSAATRLLGIGVPFCGWLLLSYGLDLDFCVAAGGSILVGWVIGGIHFIVQELDTAHVVLLKED
ncbi:hypothetical protein [Fimbriiglobus ruber]|uniref:hypothetical protein n=1 Tax=Fimbriiglobus ruber TaxID=1908690 RepID=UPI000B4B4C81|nr:hypothetical protein [Fimbriiglobus ruber]